MVETNLRTPDPALGPGQGDQDSDLGPTDQDLKKTNQMKQLKINIMISFEIKKMSKTVDEWDSQINAMLSKMYKNI